MKELEFQEEWLSAYLDDELTEEQRLVVEQRLAIDPAAQMTLNDLRRVRTMVAKLPSWSGGELKFNIPAELPDAYLDESADNSADGSVDENDEFGEERDFEEVPRSLAIADSLADTNDVSRNSAAWRTESRGSQRSMLTWLLTAASVLLMAGLGYFLWPSGGLMLSQLDQRVGTAAPSSAIGKKMEMGEPESNGRSGLDDSMEISENTEIAAPMADLPALAESSAVAPFGAAAPADPAASAGAPGAADFAGVDGSAADKRMELDAIPLSGNSFSARSADQAAPGSQQTPELSSLGSAAVAPPAMRSAVPPGSRFGEQLAEPSVSPPSSPSVASMAQGQVESGETKTLPGVEAIAGKDPQNANLGVDPSPNLGGAAMPPPANARSAGGMGLGESNVEELPSPAAAKAKADQVAGTAEKEQVPKQAENEPMLGQQVQAAQAAPAETSNSPSTIPDTAPVVAPVVIVARSPKWNDEETLQVAATQVVPFYGDSVLRYQQNAISNKQPSATEEIQASPNNQLSIGNADVLMATVKSDPTATEALFNSVVTTNQFLPVDTLQLATANQLSNQIVASGADASVANASDTDASVSDGPAVDSQIPMKANSSAAANKSATSEMIKPDAVQLDAAKPNSTSANSSESLNFANGASYPSQRGRASQNLPQGNSLVLFVTREEANRILKELQQQGEVSSQVWRVVQRASGQGENWSGSPDRGFTETRSATNGAMPSANLNSANQPSEPSVATPSVNSAATSAANPVPAGDDKVILMLNALPQ